REVAAEKHEPREGQEVQQDQRRFWLSRDEQRHADQQPLQGSGDLPGDHVGAEEGPLARGEELQPEKIYLDVVAGAQLEAQSVVDSQQEQADEQEGQDSGRLSPLPKPTAMLIYHWRRNIVVVVD